MGNYNTHSEPEQPIEEVKPVVPPAEVTVSLDQLDGFTKEQLVSYIKGIKSKNLNLPDDMTDKMKDIEIENSELIPMSIELYQKLYTLFGEYKQPANTTTKKRAFFVKPKFDADTVTKKINTVVQNISTPLDTSLAQPAAPTVPW